MTPEEAKKLLENIQKYTVNMGVGSGTFMQMKNVHKLLEAARIVERAGIKEEIIEFVQNCKDEACDGMERSRRLAPNSYGAGADWGMYEMCNYILEDIAEILSPNKDIV